MSSLATLHGPEELSQQCAGLADLRDSASRVRPSSESPAEGIFPLEFTWVLSPFPKKNLLDERTNHGLVCTHMHSIARTQKILTFMSKMGECLQQTYTQQCFIHEDGIRLHLWLYLKKKKNKQKTNKKKKNGHIRKDLTKNGETVRSTWDRRRRGRRRPLLEKGIREQAISVLPVYILTYIHFIP